MCARLLLLVLLAAAACAPPSAAPAAGGSAPQAAPPAPGGQGAPGAAPTAPPSLVEVRTGYTTVTPSMGGFWVAADGGYFQRHGLDADVSFIRAGSEVLGAVASREMPLAIGGGLEFLAAALEGSEHVMVGGMTNKLTVSLYVAPNIRAVTDLRGQAIAVSRFGAITHYGALKILELNGLREMTDVAIIQTGGVPESLAALQTGAVQGAILTPPNTLQARQLGYPQLVDTAALDIPSAGSVVGTTRGYLRDRPEVVERYLAALIEGMHRFITDREFAITTIGKYTRTDDREVLAEAYDYYQGTLQQDLQPSFEGLQAQLDQLVESKPQARTANPNDFVDIGPLTKVRATGLVERLYGQ
jgi:NitT/TauT family transport system substrate-binding protein